MGSHRVWTRVSLSVRALVLYRDSWSENGCPKNFENSYFLILKICVKIIILPKKNQSQRGVLKKNYNLISCFSKEFLTQTLRSGKFEFSKFFGHPVSDQLPQYRHVGRWEARWVYASPPDFWPPCITYPPRFSDRATCLRYRTSTLPHNHGGCH